MILYDNSLAIMRVHVFYVREMDIAFVLGQDVVAAIVMHGFVHFTISCVHMRTKVLILLKEGPIAEAVMCCLGRVVCIYNVF